MAFFSIFNTCDFTITITDDPNRLLVFNQNFLITYTYDNFNFFIKYISINENGVALSTKETSDKIVSFFKNIINIMPIVLENFKTRENPAEPYENHSADNYKFMSLIEGLTFSDELDAFIINPDIEAKVKNIINTKFEDLNSFINFGELHDFVVSNESLAIKMLDACAKRHNCVLSEQMKKNIIVSSII